MPARLVCLLYLAVAITAATALPEPVAAQDAAAPAANSRGRKAEATIPAEADPADDARIARRLRRILVELGGYERVQVRVSGGVVHLGGEVTDSAALTQLEAMAGRIEGVAAVENEVVLSTDLEERLAPAIDRLGRRIRGILQSAPLLLVAIAAGGLVAFGGWLLAGRLQLWQRLAPNAFVAEVYTMLARLGFLVLGLLVALEILDATALLGAVLGAAGLAGLALGFAVRDTVENFIASLMLSLRQPFRPNDLVEIEGSVGRVARLTSRATILISPDGNHIRIPNATVFKGRIVNYTRDPERRFSFTLGVDAENDLAAALATGVAAIKALPFVLDEPPVAAWVEDVGDSNVLLTFSGWIDQTRTDFPKARGEAVRAAKAALEGAGFGLPEPIYRVRLVSVAAQATPVVPQALFPGPRVADPARPPLPAAGHGSAVAAPPPESDPSAPDSAAAQAVARERQATDVGTDLLAGRPRAE